MKILKSTIFRLTGGNKTVFGIMLISAAYVIVARLLGPMRMTWDLSIQLEASYRFVEGLGLTNAFSSQFDLNQPPIAEYLTHFPPGLSLLVAPFLQLKIPLATTLKFIYSLTTAVGWLGWSVIGSYCLSTPSKIGSKLLPINLFIAAILPLFYTPSWTEQGTDIFLWAGIPVVILLLLNSWARFPWSITTAAAGLVLSLLLTLRYASGFLLLAGILIIFYSNWPDLKSMARRTVIFSVSSLVFVVPMMLYIRTVSGNSTAAVSNNDVLHTHGGRYLETNSFEWLLDSVEKIFSSLSNLYFLTGINSRQLNFIKSFPSVFNNVLGLFLCILIILLSWKLIKGRKNQEYFFGGDLVISLSLSLSSFLLFSIALVFVLSYSPFIIERYYLPVIIGFIFLMYALSTTISGDQVFRGLSKLFIAVFLLYNLSKPVYHALFGEMSDLMIDVLAISRISEFQYPSNEILFVHQESLDFLVAASNQEPNALFFVQSYPMYMGYLNFPNPLNFRRISDESFWENAYLSEPTTIFWVTNEDECPVICASLGNFNSDDPEDSIQDLVSLPNLKTVFASPQEEVKVMVSTLPAGYRFSGNS